MQLLSSVIAVVIFCFAPAQSVNYVRWGRTKCDGGASPLYKGYAAGAHYTHAGSGVEYLCLSDDPQWGNIVPGRQANGGWIYGTEYEFNTGFTNNKPFSYANNGGIDLQNYNAPCVVCYRSDKSEMIMVPGRMSCPGDGMNLEYNGYLSSTHYGFYKSSWVCLDSAPESIIGSSANNDGALFYPVEADCTVNSLPCPPYEDGYEISCAVCTI